jgi:5'(3')-deoxyribonucleotidase
MNKPNILLDMDGVLSDFLSGALDILNEEYNKDYTVEDYVKYGKFSINEFYGISISEFWDTLSLEWFWEDLKPFEWTYKLYDGLCQLGDVTIVTSPSLDPNCAKEKLMWLRRCLGVKSTDVFIGSKKYLMAGNGILIDDYYSNVDKFKSNGGKAVLVPSNWNTPNLTFDMVWGKIKLELNE